MLLTLGVVAREIRKATGHTQQDIATVAGVSDAVISNLEVGARYPARLDEVVAAYEKVCGLPVDDLWRFAAERL